MTVSSYILIQTEVGKAAAVVAAVRSRPGVVQADDVTGPSDVSLRCEAGSVGGLLCPGRFGRLFCGWRGSLGGSHDRIEGGQRYLNFGSTGLLGGLADCQRSGSSWFYRGKISGAHLSHRLGVRAYRSLLLGAGGTGSRGGGSRQHRSDR